MPDSSDFKSKYRGNLRGRNVLFLTPDLFGPPGGIARHARNVCLALSESGAQLSVVALHDTPKARALAESTLPGVRYYPCRGRKSSFVGRTVSTLRRRPSIVLVEHAHFSHLGWLFARMCRARLVVFGHGVEVWDRLRPLPRVALQNADLFLCPSRCTAERAAVSNHLQKYKIRVLPHCLPPGFTPVVRPSDGPVLSLLTVGRLAHAERYKGHDTVITALPELLRRFPDLVYDIVGDGDLREHLEELVRAAGVTHAVRFHGIISEEELARRYAAASVFVMPSQREGFGFVFLEAMSHGTPVIAGNEDAAGEVVRDGETGFLVDPMSVEQLADRIVLLLADTRLRQEMGSRAARIARDHFSFAAFSQNLLEYLLEPAGSRAELEQPEIRQKQGTR